MSQENVEIVRRSNIAFNRGDRDGTFADYHPDVEWSDLQHAPDAPETVRGIAAVYAIWDQWNASFEEFTADVDEYINTGDFVVTVTRWHVRGGASGLTFDQLRAELYAFDDGKITPVTLGYAEKAEALKTVGLEE